MHIIYWFAYALVQVIIAYINNRMRLSAIAAGKDHAINHPLWFGIYCASVVPMLFVSWKLTVSVLALHGSVFPVLYNGFAKLKAFNLSTTTEAKTDQELIEIGFKNMLVPDLIFFVTSLFFLWL